MSDPTENLLLVITDRSVESLRRAKQRYATDRVSVLCFDPGLQDEPLPISWRRLAVADLLDAEALRRDFLDFIDAWPRRPLLGQKSFDDMFRRPEGYSVWWTGPGTERHPDSGVFPKLRVLWLCNRAIEAADPQRILIHTAEPDLAWSLASRCQSEGLEYEFLPTSAVAARAPHHGQIRWLAGALVLLLCYPWRVLVRAALARLLTGTPRETAAQRESPAVVCASPLLDYRVERGRVSINFWEQLHKALIGSNAAVRIRYFGHSIKGSTLHRSTRPGRWTRLWNEGPALRRRCADLRLLGKIDDAVPPREAYLACRSWLGGAAVQLAALVRYCRLERTPTFGKSFLFARADVASFYVPLLRRAVAGMAKWSHTVGCIRRALRSVGNVKALLVTEEMYRIGMLHIAAARGLGIPSIGVQHGTIFPMHLIYTLPPGQVAGAPVPDYFAAYGAFAKETLCDYGAFPADRVWITGSPRFDQLVNTSSDTASVRERLGLPQDRRVLLVATQDYPWFQQAAKAVFEACKDHADHLVCMKIHRRDVSADVYRRIARQVGARNVRFFSDSFDDLLAACDVLISGSSTTVFEATLLGRRTICVNFSDEPDRYPYVADGASLGARSEEQIRTALNRVLDPNVQQDLEAGRERFLKRHAGPGAEGRAAESLAGMIAQFCRDDNSKSAGAT